jgi:membrane peptidoglycan carboxypeptidase
MDATVCVVVPPRIEVEATPVVAEGAEGAVAVEGAPAEPELIRKVKAKDDEEEKD